MHGKDNSFIADNLSKKHIIKHWGEDLFTWAPDHANIIVCAVCTLNICLLQKDLACSYQCVRIVH